MPPHSPERRERRRSVRLPFYYRTLTVLLLLGILLLTGLWTSLTVTRKAYNTTPNHHWIQASLLETAPTNNNATRNNLPAVLFALRTIPRSAAGAAPEQYFFVTQQPISGYTPNDNSNKNAVLFEQVVPVGDELTGNQVVEFVLSDLEPGQTYYYARAVSSTADDSWRIQWQGQITTPPSNQERFPFTLLLGGSATPGSQHDIFAQLSARGQNTEHYSLTWQLPSTTRDEQSLSTVDINMGSPSQAALVQQTAVLRNAIDVPTGHADTNYHTRHYFAVTIGTVRLIYSDLHTERTETSLMSVEQKFWLYDELQLASTNHDFVVWITPLPWMGTASVSWNDYPNERAQLSEWISSLNPQKLLVVSAGTNILALDDGSHTYYGAAPDNSATTEQPQQIIASFPLLQLGPLDRMGGHDDAPYSEGCSAHRWERNHYYSTLSFVETTQEEACLDLVSYRIGRRNGKEEIIQQYTWCGSSIFVPRDTLSYPVCQTEFTSQGMTILSVFLVVFTFVVAALGFWVESIVQGFLLLGCTLLGSGMTTAVMILVPRWVRDIDAIETFTIGIVLLIQLTIEALFLGAWARFRQCVQKPHERARKEATRQAQMRSRSGRGVFYDDDDKKRKNRKKKSPPKEEASVPASNPSRMPLPMGDEEESSDRSKRSTARGRPALPDIGSNPSPTRSIRAPSSRNAQVPKSPTKEASTSLLPNGDADISEAVSSPGRKSPQKKSNIEMEDESASSVASSQISSPTKKKKKKKKKSRSSSKSPSKRKKTMDSTSATSDNNDDEVEIVFELDNDDDDDNDDDHHRRDSV